MKIHASSPSPSPALATDGVKPLLHLSNRTRILGALAVTITYAVCFTLIKAGLDYAPPLRFAALRTIVAGLALLSLVLVRREPVVPPRRIWLPLVALSLVATTIAYGAMFLSPGRTGAGIASVLGNAQPLVVVVLAAIFVGERLTRGKSLALVLGLGGVTLIAYPALTGPGAYGFSGAVLALAASIGSAGGSIIVKRMGQMPSLLATTAWSLILGGMPLLLASSIAERSETTTWNITFVSQLLFLAIVGTALASAVWYWLVQRDDIGRLTMYLFLVPVVGLTIATLVFDEPIGVLEGIGVALTIAGIGAAVLESRREVVAHHDCGSDAVVVTSDLGAAQGTRIGVSD